MESVNLSLAAGLLCAALGAGLLPFVMFGLLGVIIYGVAFALLLAAGITARPAGIFPVRQQLVSVVSYVVGVTLLLAVAAYASSMAYDQATSSRHALPAPSMWDWMILGLLSFLGALTYMLGVRCQARWSWSRCSVWGVAGLCVVPSSLVLFCLFATALPLVT